MAFKGLGRASKPADRFKASKVVSPDTCGESQRSHKERNPSGPWKTFEMYAKRFRAFSGHLGEFERSLSLSFSTSSSLDVPYHRSQVVEVVNFWTQNQDRLVEHFLDVPAEKRKLLTRHVETLNEALPLLDEQSLNIAANQGSLSVTIRKVRESLKRVAAKMDERARWYRAHPDDRPHWMK
jgi:hypothetical protein